MLCTSALPHLLYIFVIRNAATRIKNLGNYSKNIGHLSKVISERFWGENIIKII